MDLQIAQWNHAMSGDDPSCQTTLALNTLAAGFVESFPKLDYEYRSISVDGVTSILDIALVFSVSILDIALSFWFSILDTALFFLTSNLDIGSAYP
jgi:hypothetical protein